jgi:WD40 repeat protein
VSSGDEEFLRVWDTQSGEELRTLWLNYDARSDPGSLQGPLNALALSPDGTRIVAGWRDGTFRLLDAASGVANPIRSGDAREVRAVAASPDGRWIVSVIWDGNFEVRDAETGEVAWTLSAQADVEAVAVSLDGRWIVSGSEDDTLKVWDTTAGALVDEIPVDGRPRSIAFAASDIWVGCGNGTLCRYTFDR